jgi:aspartyl-tRNA(Asn)/glutamyl-tRNA(Gln) amidotransferase subunit A
MSFCDMPVADLLAGYARKTFSPVEVITGFLRRIEQFDPVLNAFRVVDPEGALRAARESEQRYVDGTPLSPFDGLPASIKDQWLLKGFSTLAGSLLTDPLKIASEDSPAAQRLREGGAVFMGKTNLCEFSWNGVTSSALKGESRNPWNRAKNSGGSSGGAAIAAAARMSVLNIASDGAGSIRIPAAFCGVFGLKPTYGRVPAYPQGLLPNCSHTGPITKTVFEAALMMDAITRYDAREWLAVGDPDPRYVKDLEAGIAGLRIAYSRELWHAKVDAAIVRAVDEAVKVLADQGAIITEAYPDVPDPRAAFEVIYESSLAAGVGSFSVEEQAKMDAGYVRNASRGRQHTVEDLMRALAAREDFGRRMNAFHERFDLMVTPQLAVTAFDCGADVPPQRGMREWLDWSPFTYLFNLTQQPAAAVPCGFDAEGLPIAFQIVGPRHADKRVLQAARAYERVRPFAVPDVADGISA